jgi:hypothetical protein
MMDFIPLDCVTIHYVGVGGCALLHGTGIEKTQNHNVSITQLYYIYKSYVIKMLQSKYCLKTSLLFKTRHPSSPSGLFLKIN